MGKLLKSPEVKEAIERAPSGRVIIETRGNLRGSPSSSLRKKKKHNKNKKPEWKK